MIKYLNTEYQTYKKGSFFCFVLNHFNLGLEILGGKKTALVPILAVSEFPLLSPLCGDTPDHKMVTEVYDPNHWRYQVTTSPMSLTT